MFGHNVVVNPLNHHPIEGGGVVEDSSRERLLVSVGLPHDNQVAQFNISRGCASVPHLGVISHVRQQSGDGFLRESRAERSAARAIARVATHGPSVARISPAVLEKSKTEDVAAILFIRNLVAVATLDEIVVPACQLVLLTLGHPAGLGHVEEASSNQAATDQINGVMVAEIHCRPPNPTSVDDEEGLELGEAVDHEESFEHGVGSVQRGECTERQRRTGKIGGVEVDAENLIDSSQSSGRSGHAVGGRHQAMLVLIPRRGAGEEDLDGDTEDAHPAQCSREDGSRTGGSEDERDQRHNGGGTKVHDAVRQPGEDVENRVLVGGEDVGKVGTVENILERGKNSDPDVWSVLIRNKSGQFR